MARPTLINSDAMPPTKGAAYPVFVPKTDADGRDLAGLRLPTLDEKDRDEAGCKRHQQHEGNRHHRRPAWHMPLCSPAEHHAVHQTQYRAP